jgi:hypothetical protein
MGKETGRQKPGGGRIGYEEVGLIPVFAIQWPNMMICSTLNAEG